MKYEILPVLSPLFLFIEVKMCLALAVDMFSGRGWGFTCVTCALTILSCFIVGAIFLIHHDPPESAKEDNLTHVLDEGNGMLPKILKRSLKQNSKDVRVELGKDLSVEFCVDQLESFTPWQSRTMGLYGKYLCKAPCKSWSQVIAHTERDGYVNPYTQFGTRWSIVRVVVLDCVPEQRKYCIKVRINIKAVNTQDLGLWYVGFDQFSTDTMVPFQVAEVRVDKENMIGRSSTNPSKTTAIPCVIIQGKGILPLTRPCLI
jgi:hypothetical protein